MIDVTASENQYTQRTRSNTFLMRRPVNASVSACSLPPELLVQIFETLKELLFPFLNWVYSATHVCAYWRSIAVASPSLWNLITPWHDEQVKTFVSRSGALPLKLKWGHPKRLAALDAMASYTNRFSEVMLWLEPAQMTKFAQTAFKLQWDNIHILALSILDNPDIRVPINFVAFAEAPPKNLRELRLRGVFPWSLKETAMYRSLRSLEMNNCFNTDFYRPTLDVFLGFLDACSQLEELSLVMSGPKLLPEEMNQHPDPKRTITFPNLCRLYLVQSRAVDSAYIISHIVFPTTTKLQVETCHIFDRDHPSLFSCLPNGIDSQASHTESVRNLLDEAVGVCIKQAGENLEVDITRRDGELLLEAESIVDPGLAWLVVHRTLADVGRFLRGSSLESLLILEEAIYVLKYIPRQDWPGMLAGLHSLTKLSLQFPLKFRGAVNMVKNCMSNLEAPDRETPPPLPQLKTLEFLDLPRPPSKSLQQTAALFIKSRRMSGLCDIEVIMKEAEDDEGRSE